MRDADLWEDVGNFLVHSCGKRLGNVFSAAIEVAAGETDLAAASEFFSATSIVFKPSLIDLSSMMTASVQESKAVLRPTRRPKSGALSCRGWWRARQWRPNSL